MAVESLHTEWQGLRNVGGTKNEFPIADKWQKQIQRASQVILATRTYNKWSLPTKAWDALFFTIWIMIACCHLLNSAYLPGPSMTAECPGSHLMSTTIPLLSSAVYRWGSWAQRDYIIYWSSRPRPRSLRCQSICSFCLLPFTKVPRLTAYFL